LRVRLTETANSITSDPVKAVKRPKRQVGGAGNDR